MQTSTSKKTRVCVPVCEKDLAAMRNGCELATEWADVIELRLDCLAELPNDAASVLNNFSRPVILTFQPTEQGGHRDSPRAERKAFWTSLPPKIKSDWWDVEGVLIADLSLNSPRVIVSHHEFPGVPKDLEQIYERLAATPA